MSNQIVAQIAEINTLEAQGFALAKEWKSICKADKSRFTKFTKADGFDTKLGKLMFALKQEANGRISTDRLKECGINIVDKRRRSEALWFVENEQECRAFIESSKKGFTNLTALQSAMRKAEKSAKADKADEQPKADTPEQPKAESKSNVGLTASDIALEVMVQVELLANANSISTEAAFKEVMLAIKDAASMADKVAA